MDILSAMVKLRAIEAALSITSPVTLAVKRTYLWIPHQGSAVPDAPAWLNTYQLQEHNVVNRRFTSIYTVSMNLVLREANLDRAGEIALNFHVALKNALEVEVNQTLTSTVNEIRNFRTARELPAVLEIGKQAFVGLSELLDLQIVTTMT